VIFVVCEDEVLRVEGGAVRSVLSGVRPRVIVACGGRLSCGTWGHGVLRSDDGGREWQPARERSLADARVMALAAICADGAAPADVLYCGVEPSAVFRSTDGGRDWTPLAPLTSLPSSSSWSFPPRPHTHHVRSIVVDPFDPDRLYVCVEAGALVRSFDGGASWQDRVPGSPRDTHTLLAHPRERGRLYAAAGDGYFESRDGGDTWHAPRDGLDHGYAWSVAVHRRDASLRVITAAPGPRQAHDAGSAESHVYRRAGAGSWRRIDAGLPAGAGTTAGVLAADPADDDALWLATNRGLFHSRDFGATWVGAEAALPASLARQRVKDLKVVR
jgi:photosystem II stability/assembly factor-like uncharacterized protein